MRTWSELGETKMTKTHRTGTGEECRSEQEPGYIHAVLLGNGAESRSSHACEGN